VKGVAEFQQHYCSPDLREFLAYDRKQFGMASGSRGEPIDPTTRAASSQIPTPTSDSAPDS